MGIPDRFVVRHRYRPAHRLEQTRNLKVPIGRISVGGDATVDGAKGTRRGGRAEKSHVLQPRALRAMSCHQQLAERPLDFGIDMSGADSRDYAPGRYADPVIEYTPWRRSTRPRK